MQHVVKTFRLFVSSTFNDLKEERNALQKHVFPKLQELCTHYGCRFQAIDLRWGVSEEAALDQRTMRICMDELFRCQKITSKPNFLILLGDRYGWQPLPEKIPTDEFRNISSHMTDDEIRFIFHHWYKEDRNNVPPVFVLQARKRGEIYENQTIWEKKVERPLRLALQKIVKQLNLPDEENMKYHASATHQEIKHGAMKVADAEQHVFGVFRKITNLSEVEKSLQGHTDNEKKINDIGKIPKPEDFVDTDGQVRFDQDAHTKLETLKKELQEKIGGNVYTYEVQWKGQGINMDHIGSLPENLEDCETMLGDEYKPKTLCERVWQNLAKVISVECQKNKLKTQDSVELEMKVHQAFGKNRATAFVGREDILAEIEKYLSDDRKKPLALYGVSGSGKSALMAKAIQRIHEAVATNEQRDVLIIQRFIGTTPESATIGSLLTSICQEMNHAYGRKPFSQSGEIKELIHEFHVLLKMASSKKKVVIFLDALDQLSNMGKAEEWSWLHFDLPEQAKIVVTTISEPHECLALLRDLLPKQNLLELKAMARQEAKKILEKWFEGHHIKRTLQVHQEEEVLTRFSKCGLPLYLKLAFEEARLWHSYDGVPEYDGKQGLAAGIPGIIENLFWRLSRPENHGPLLVSRTMAYLSIARNGLAEEEIVDILSQDEEFFISFKKNIHHDLPEERLPIVLWSRLYHDLEPYLTERETPGTHLLTFYHRQFQEIVRKQYLCGVHKKMRHQTLALYFLKQPYLYRKESNRTPNYRKVMELPHQLKNAEMWSELSDTLTDLNFHMTKCMADMVYDLLNDYQGVESLPMLNREIINSWAVFFNQRANILLRGNPKWPAHKILLQLSIEHGENSPISEAAEAWLETGNCDWLWLRSLCRRDPFGCLAVLPQDPFDWLEGVVELENGDIITWSRYAFTWWTKTGVFLQKFQTYSDGLFALADGRILSWNSESHPVLWDLNMGVSHQLEDTWEDARQLSDNRILSWRSNGDIVLRSGETCEEIEKVATHAAKIKGVEELPDGMTLIWSESGLLSLLDLNGEKRGKTKSWQLDPLEDIFVLQNGTIILYDEAHGQRSAIRLFNPNTGDCTTNQLEIFSLWNVIELKDKKVLLVASSPNLSLLDLKDGNLRPLTEQKYVVSNAHKLQDGRILLICTDGGFRIYNPLTNMCQSDIGINPSGYVKGFLELCEDRGISWSRGGNSRIWSLIQRQEGGGEHYKCGTGQKIKEMRDKRLLSIGSRLAIWNACGGILESYMKEVDKVIGAIELENGMICFWTMSSTSPIRIWDGKTEGSMYTPEGVSFLVKAAVELRYDMILLLCRDNTLKIWEYTADIETMLYNASAIPVDKAVVLQEGFICWWSHDKDSTIIGSIQVYSDGFQSSQKMTLPWCEIIDVVLFRYKYILCRLSGNRILMWEYSSNKLANLHESDFKNALQQDMGVDVDELFSTADSSGQKYLIAGQKLFECHQPIIWKNKLWCMSRNGNTCCITSDCKNFPDNIEWKLFESKKLYEKRMWAKLVMASEDIVPTYWHGENVFVHLLRSDGTIVVSDNGVVLVLQLFYGSNAISSLEYVEKEEKKCPMKSM